MGSDQLRSPKLAKLPLPGKVLAFSLADKRCLLGPKSMSVLAMAEVERHKG